MIAFDKALQLEDQGLPIGFVALFDAPGPRLQLKAWLKPKRELARFTAALHTGEGDSRLRRLRDKLTQAARELTNYMAYKLKSDAKWFSDALRFRMLRGVLNHGRPVPRFVQGISVETVLALARKDYTPSRLLEGRALLFRATEGEGNDEPAVSLSTDPLLDWGGRAEGRAAAI
jgi:hypothetical protein